ncbi:MAG: anion transporter, partial [Alphaproteobacteria bacterium]
VITALADARGAHVSPLLLAVPLAMAGSCAFMLPVATGPNAIVYASGTMRIADMAKAGFWLNLVGIAVITAVSVWILPHLF